MSRKHIRAIVVVAVLVVAAIVASVYFLVVLPARGRHMSVTGRLEYSQLGIYAGAGRTKHYLYLVDDAGKRYWLKWLSPQAERALYTLREGDTLSVEGTVWRAKAERWSGPGGQGFEMPQGGELGSRAHYVIRADLIR
jgi:hypothetical protein